MTEFVSAKGDLLAAEAEVLVNTVNCVGVMGKGIALAFKKAYPDNFEAYAAACKANRVRPGKILVFKCPPSLAGPRFIFNYPTKRHWKQKSLLSDVEAALPELVNICRSLKVASIAIPPLGCGLGGLDWTVVRPKVEKALSVLPDLKVIFYDPPGFVPKMAAPATQGRAMGRPSSLCPF